VLLLVLLAAATLLAQYRSKRRPAHLLRAVGVLEWPVSGGTPRLVPLIILADGQYYDASIYRASPVPMAVEPGTVYEGQEAGVAKGLFTIRAAQELAQQKLWYGAGAWAEGETGTYARAPREEDRPILRRAQPEESGAPAPASQTTPAPQAPTERQLESDPNRPVLGHGKPAARTAEPAASAPAKQPVAPAPAAAAPPPAAPRRMVAVSDAQPGESRSFVLNWSPSEKEALKKKAVALAETEIAKYTLAPGGQHAVAGPLTDLQVHFFDVFSDNAPEIVLSARLPAGTYAARAARASRRSKVKTGAAQAQPDIYITLVARSDLDGNLRRIFVSLTDSGRLDAVPRLELIDAVDADGRGVGQLLFHQIGPKDTGLEGNVVLYRVDPYRLTELFDSWVQ
jgi:hypothetical protein